MVFYIVLVVLIVFTLGIVIFLIYERKEEAKEILNGKQDSTILYKNQVNKEKELNKKHKVLRVIYNISLDIVLVILGLALIGSITGKIMNNTPFPYKSVVIKTGSMSYKNESNDYLFTENLNNQIEVNDLIFLKRVDSINELKKYDIICYVNSDNLRIVHRIIDINESTIITRGDANNASDSPITFNEVIGLYAGIKIPKVGYITFFISSNYGISAISAISVLLITYLYLDSYVKKKIETRLNDLNGYINNSNYYLVISNEGIYEYKNKNYSYKEFADDENSYSNTLIVIKDETLIGDNQNERKEVY